MDELRRRAEERTAALELLELEPLSLEATRRLVHELRVHQIELELQNEELRSAEMALETARARYFDLYELAPVGYLTLDASGTILEANLLAAALLELPRGQLLGLPLHRFLLPADQDVFYQHRRLLISHREPRSFELRLAQRSGPPRWVGMEASVTQDDQRGADVFKVAINDITARKKLEVKVAQSERLASLGMLAASVAHEINNPLAYVIPNLEILARQLPSLLDASVDTPGATEMKKRLGDVLEGTGRIAVVTRGLNAFLRFDHQPIAPFQIHEAIDSALVLAQNDLRHRAKVTRNYAVVPAIGANKVHLSQVFLNLLTNAAQSIDDGAADRNEVLLRTWQEGREVCAEVRDTGKGISRSEQPSVFEPFFTSKQQAGGLGLGLAISKEIIASWGGSITVSSEPGVGTSFVVRLPIATGVESEPTSASHGEPKEHGLGRRILVVDDEPAIREIMAHALGAHTIVEADSGAAARDILRQDQRFDLILCDLMMPNVSGVELHQWLSQEHPVLAERVMFITGGVFTGKTSAYLAETGAQCLEKPFRAASLRRAVAERLAALRENR